MTLPLSPQRIAATYECLRQFPPFCRMKLPSADTLRFQVSRHADRFGHYTRYLGTERHFIVISAVKNGHFNTLAQTVAHEMIHLHQAVAKTETSGAEHNAEFHRLTARVCKAFGWDTKAFVG